MCVCVCMYAYKVQYLENSFHFITCKEKGISTKNKDDVFKWLDLAHRFVPTFSSMDKVCDSKLFS